MESNNLHSVQDEQFGKNENAAETTQTSSPSSENSENESKVEDQKPLEVTNNEETEAFDSHEVHHLIPEELEIPDELSDESNIVDDILHSEINMDYSSLSKEELVECAAKLLKEKSIEDLKADFDAIKIQFYKNTKPNSKNYANSLLKKAENLKIFCLRTMY